MVNLNGSQCRNVLTHEKSSREENNEFIVILKIFSLRLNIGSIPFQLRGPLIIWNTMLSMFSIMGAFRTAPELIHVLRHYGLFHSVCVPRHHTNQQPLNETGAICAHLNV
ncbi:hypothetical protein GQX74_012853 [Glossina fuscipes]|nr:hypothetical protein GQX74_012853 [Glossina fuscipes]